MNSRKAILKIFRGEDPEQVVWQPRIENWYDVKERQEALPESYQGLSLLDVYDKLKCSPRPYVGASLEHAIQPESDQEYGDWQESERVGGGYSPQETPPVFTNTLEGGGITYKRKLKGDDLIEVWKTPKGDLTRKWRVTDLSISLQPYGYPVKQVEHLEVMEYILRHQKVEFHYDNYEFVRNRMGGRAPLAISAPRAPFQQFLLFYMGYEQGVVALHKHTDAIENFLESAERIDDRFYEVFKDCPIEVVNFPDNVDGHFDPPPFMEDYLIPHWQQRTEELHAAGMHIDVHWDGSVKSILRYTHEVGVDGFEVLTPEPQGDVTIDEISQALGDNLILLDGIPATYFMPGADEKTLKDTVEKLIKEFAPKLILGISDEMPANGDIKKVSLVSEMVEGYNSN